MTLAWEHLVTGELNILEKKNQKAPLRHSSQLNYCREKNTITKSPIPMEYV